MIGMFSLPHVKDDFAFAVLFLVRIGPEEKPKAKIKGRLGFRGNVATRRCERLATETPQQREAKLERTMHGDRLTNQTVQNSVVL